jgi:hypothetical protein
VLLQIQAFPEFALHILGSGNGNLSHLTFKAFYFGKLK